MKISGTSQLTKTARQPRLVLAIRAPSVVDIGTKHLRPLINKGPTIPVGTGTYPITFSQQHPYTYKIALQLHRFQRSQTINKKDLQTRKYLRGCSHTVEMADYGKMHWRSHRNVAFAMKQHGENHNLIFFLDFADSNVQNLKVALFLWKETKNHL